MFDEIAKSAGLAGPQSAQVSSSPGWYDQSKIQAAVAAQGAGADGRTVLSGNNLLSVLNSIKAPKYVADPNAGRSAAEKSLLTAYQPDYGGQAGGDNGYYESANGTSLKSWKGADGQTYFQDTYDNPYGNGEKDKVDVVYRIDPASGQAIPVADDGAGHKTNARYQGSAWINNYRDLASVAAVVGSAGLAGAASAGAFGTAGTGTAAGTGAAASTGTATGADLAAFYGGGEAAGGGLAAGAGGASGADLAAFYGGDAAATGGGVAGGTGGLTAADVAAGQSATGATTFGGSGGALTGATNPALIESGVGTAGYGASSAGAGGATGSSFLSGLGNFLGSNQGLSALGSIGSSVLNSYFANKALSAQTDAANNATALAKYQYDTSRNDWAPYRQLGYEGLQGYSNLLKDPSSITSNPGYAFQLGQGQQAVDRSAASKGGLYSGATLKALDRFGQGLASTSYDQALSRYGNAAQIGATGTQGTQQAGQQYVNQASNNITGLGNAQAGNALFNGANYGNALSQGISAYNDYRKYGGGGG